MNNPSLPITPEILLPILSLQNNDLPNWQELPQACRQELVLALTELLLEQLEASHECQP